MAQGNGLTCLRQRLWLTCQPLQELLALTQRPFPRRRLQEAAHACAPLPLPTLVPGLEAVGVTDHQVEGKAEQGRQDEGHEGRAGETSSLSLPLIPSASEVRGEATGRKGEKKERREPSGEAVGTAPTSRSLPGWAQGLTLVVEWAPGQGTVLAVVEDQFLSRIHPTLQTSIQRPVTPMATSRDCSHRASGWSPGSFPGRRQAFLQPLPALGLPAGALAERMQKSGDRQCPGKRDQAR